MILNQGLTENNDRNRDNHAECFFQNARIDSRRPDRRTYDAADSHGDDQRQVIGEIDEIVLRT